MEGGGWGSSQKQTLSPKGKNIHIKKWKTKNMGRNKKNHINIQKKEEKICYNAYRAMKG